MTDTLDRRARGAAADLHDAVAATDHNELLPSRRPLAAVVALTLVLVAAGALFLGGDDEQVLTSNPPSRPPASLHLGLTPATGSAQLLWASEDGSVESDAGNFWQAWGRPGADDATFVVVLNSMPYPDEELSVGGAYDEILVGDQIGFLVDAPNGGRSLMFLVEQRMVMLLTSTLTDDELAAIATGARLDDARHEVIVDPSTVPAGLEPIGVVDDVAYYGSGVAGRPGVSSTTSTWVWNGRGSGITISAIDHADADVELLNRISLGFDLPARTVRGRPAWQSADGQQVVWRPTDDVLVLLTTSEAHTGVDEPELSADEVLALAEAVTPVDDDVWEAMLATETDEPDESPVTTAPVAIGDDGIPVDAVRTDGILPSGATMTVYRNHEGRVCGGIWDDGGGEAACPGRGIDFASVIYEDGQPVGLFGEAAPGAVEVRIPIGDVVVGPQVVDPEGERIWCIDLATVGIPVPDEVIEVDAAGNEVRRVPVRR